VKGYFGPIPAKPRPKAPDTDEPAPSGEKVVPLKDAHAKLPAVAVSWKGMPKRGTTDYYALVLLGRALVSGKSARLFQTLVKESQTAVSLDGGLGFPIAGWDEYKAPALFGVMAVRKPDAPFEKVRGLIADAAKSAGSEGLTDAELERVKIKFRSDWVRAQETRLGRATRLLQDALLDGDAEVANEELGRYMAVTNDDIRKAAAAYLRPEAATWFDVAAGGAQ